MRVEARAKINWTLDITGKRDDGYHLMDMLMQPVTLADTLEIHPAREITLTVSGYPRVNAGEDNLALRAARLLRETTGSTCGAHIHLHKRIPVGAGMGGGSADAAGVLTGLNQLWGTGLTLGELEQLGLHLGADVPFCLRGGLQRARGVGEELLPLPCGGFFWLVVLQPCPGLSTKAVFSNFHLEQVARHPATDGAMHALKTGNLSLLCQSLYNVLQPVSEALRPEIARGVAALIDQGAAGAWMTGSGSAVFGVFTSAQMARRAEHELRKQWHKCWMTHSCMESIVVQA